MVLVGFLLIADGLTSSPDMIPMEAAPVEEIPTEATPLEEILMEATALEYGNGVSPNSHLDHAA